MRLKDEPASKNFHDRTQQTLSDKFNDLVFRFGYNFIPGYAAKVRSSGRVSPEENDAYVRQSKAKSKFDYSKMTVSDFTPQEWKLIKENGFGLDDIMLLRQNNARR